MGKDWIEYQSRSGQTLFVYNKETGEHKWPLGLEKGIEYRIMHGRPVEYKELSTTATQTDDNGCNNGCMSMYVNDLNTINTTLLQRKCVLYEEHSLNNVHGLEDTVKLEHRDEQYLGQSSGIVMVNQSNLMENSNDNGNDYDSYSKNTSKNADDQCLNQKLYKISETLTKIKEMETSSEQSHLENTSFCEESVDAVLGDNDEDGEFASMVYSRSDYDGHRYSSMAYCGDDNVDSGGNNFENRDKNFGVDGCNVGSENIGNESTVLSSQDDNLTKYLYSENGRPLVYPYMIAPVVNTPETVLNANAFTAEGMQSTPGINKSASSEVNLFIHKKRQDNKIRNNKNYACTFCDKKFSRKDTLTLHIRYHTGEKLLECSYCGKKFAKKWDLIRHAERHTNRKTKEIFQCFVCKESFVLKEYLLAHFKAHVAMGQNPLQCPVCQRQFIQKMDFDKHVETHIAEKSPQKFMQSNNIGKNVDIQVEEKPFEYAVVYTQ